ncbi:uncharacterized protein LOC126248624 [Schistocerca nitens]|uniref:uncharacterized protein LOC126248624 n=1 Tax=Schistocerca nitens TaxID=7011 RepID=UPI002117EC81|nr:uncharacterized protein LOC126248624 [Schistocerca nitens]
MQKRHTRNNIVEKLLNREIGGSTSVSASCGNLNVRPTLERCLEVNLRSILPASAFKFSHSFLGLSKCGQFLLSYTYTAELDVVSFNTVHKYRLHWWAFVPHQKARKVSEVVLFGDSGPICSPLYICLCQWPLDYSKVVIYGNSYETSQAQQRSYLTITTVPSLNKCQDCLKVAASYEDEDLAASWDSCVRFSCMKHSVTVHTTFDVVSPYPKFRPTVSMKCDGYVLLNTGNFLHVLSTSLEYVGNTYSYVRQQSPPVAVEQEAPENSEENNSSVKMSVQQSTCETAESPKNSIVSPEHCFRESTGSNKQDYIDSVTCASDIAIGNKQPCETALIDSQVLCHQMFSTSAGNCVLLNRSLEKCDSDSEHKTVNIAVVRQQNVDVMENEIPEGVRKADRPFNSSSNNFDKTCDFKGYCSSFPSDIFVSLLKKFQDECQSTMKDADCEADSKSHSAANSIDILDKDMLSGASRVDIVNDLEGNMSTTNKGNKRHTIFRRNKGLLTNSNEKKECRVPVPEGCDESSFVCVCNTDGRNTCSCVDTGHSISETNNLIQLSTSEKLVKNFCDKLYSCRVTRSHTLKQRKSVHRQNESDQSVKRDVKSVIPQISVGQPSRESISPEQTDGHQQRDVSIAGSPQELNINVSSCPGPEESASVPKVLSPVPKSSQLNAESSQNDESQLMLNRKRKFAQRHKSFPPGSVLKINSPSSVLNSPTLRLHSKVADEAEKAYEFKEETLESDSEKFSTYRRRRLADKKYEFCEECEDEENIVPFHLHRRRESDFRLRLSSSFLPSAAHLVNNRRHFCDSLSDNVEVNAGARSPSNSVNGSHALSNRSWYYEAFGENVDAVSCTETPGAPYSMANGENYVPQNHSHLDSDKVVLRPLNQNKTTLIQPQKEADNLSDAPVNKRSESVDTVKDLSDDLHSLQETSSNPNSTSAKKYNPARCTIQLKRSFVEVDDELVSVITDIEDDDSGESPGYHCALPLEIHGAGYMQLQMISNSKAEKLMAPCLIVLQKTFDIEHFCHIIAEKLCEESGKKYWFCNDYDVEIIDVCPYSGDAIILALMRIQATVKAKGTITCVRPLQQRKQYQGGVVFSWNVVTGESSIVETRPLVEIIQNERETKLREYKPWNPARGLAAEMRRRMPDLPLHKLVRHSNNTPVLRGKSLVRLTDLENNIELVL